MGPHNQVAGRIYGNISARFGPEKPRTTLDTRPKVAENDRAKIQSDFQIQNDKQMMANQPGVEVIDKAANKAVVIDDAGGCQTGEIPGSERQLQRM